MGSSPYRLARLGRLAVCTLVLPGLLFLASVAQAACPQHGDGKLALERSDFDAAARAFRNCLLNATEESDRWHALIGLGLTDDLAKRPIRAALYYDAFLRESGRAGVLSERWAKRRARVRVEKGRLEGAVLAARDGINAGLVRIRSMPPGSAVTIDGLTLPKGLTLATPLEILLPPGPARIELALAGFHSVERRFDVARGVTRAVVVELQSDAPPVVVSSPPESTVARIWGWSLVGSGAAMVIAGGVLTGLAQSDLSELEELSTSPGTDEAIARHATLSDRVTNTEIAYSVLYGVGAAAAVTGAILLATDAPVTTTAAPISQGAMWLVSGEF